MRSLSREVFAARVRHRAAWRHVMIVGAGAALLAIVMHRGPALLLVVSTSAPPACPIAEPPACLVAPSLACPAAELPACPAEPIRVRELPFLLDGLDPAMAYRGELVRGVRWIDAHGDNVVLLSQLRTRRSRDGMRAESSSLFAHHYVRDASGQVRLLRVVQEHDRDCTDDLVSTFHGTSLVSDLDEDGIGEITFGYFHGACITDMSAARFKLFLLENGDKHVVRGNGYYVGMDTISQPTSHDAPPGASPVFANRLYRLWPWLANQFMASLPL